MFHNAILILGVLLVALFSYLFGWISRKIAVVEGIRARQLVANDQLQDYAKTGRQQFWAGRVQGLREAAKIAGDDQPHV